MARGAAQYVFAALLALVSAQAAVPSRHLASTAKIVWCADTEQQACEQIHRITLDYSARSLNSRTSRALSLNRTLPFSSNVLLRHPLSSCSSPVTPNRKRGFVSLGKVLRFLGLVDRRQRCNCSPLRGGGRSCLHCRCGAQSARGGADPVETFALAAVIAERVLGLRMFDVQILGALALQRGDIAEMQTGEGKTLAAVPAVIWYALQRPRRACVDRQRLSGPPRRAWMARDLRMVRAFRGACLAEHDAAQRRAAYRLRRNLRDRQ